MTENVRFMPGKDIFESGAVALCNPVNLSSVMGAGLALQFKNRWPGCFEDYKEAIQLGWLRQGTIWRYYTREHRVIVHCPTKRHWQDPSPPQLVRDTIVALGRYCRITAVPRIAVPKLGCGLGGMLWEEVLPLLLTSAASSPHTKWYLYGEKI